MGLLSELESMKLYNMVLDLTTKEESYDKKRNILTGEELFKLCYQRFQRIQEVIAPLKEVLGEKVEITEIRFNDGNQEDMIMTVRYNDGDKKNFFKVTSSSFNESELSSTNDELEEYGLVRTNKRIIRRIFDQIYAESLEREIVINSASKKFRINDNSSFMNIRDINEKAFSIDGDYITYEKKGLLYVPEKTTSSIEKIKELLKDEEKVLSIYRNLRVYEDDVPKILLKKANQ